MRKTTKRGLEFSKHRIGAAAIVARAFCRRLGVPYLNRKGRRNRIVNDRRERIEHVKRIAEGGSDDAENIVGACGWRNSNRQDYEADEWFIHVQFMIRNGAHPHNFAFPETSG